MKEGREFQVDNCDEQLDRNASEKYWSFNLILRTELPIQNDPLLLFVIEK